MKTRGVCLTVVLSLLAGSKVAAVTLNPGDILVTDSGLRAVIRVDPVSGVQTVVSSGEHFVRPAGLTVAANGDILVADSAAFGGGGGIIRVNPATGARTVVSNNAISVAVGGAGSFDEPLGIAIAANGDILVVDSTGLASEVIRVNPLTGAQTIVSSGGSFAGLQDIEIEANGDILVLDQAAFGGPGGVIRVNPITGAQTTVSSGGSFVNPFGMAIAANGDILVADGDAFGGSCGGSPCGGVIRVNPVTGAQTTVSSGGSFFDPVGIGVAANGDIFVSDANSFGGPGGVIRVNPVTGAQTIVSSGMSFVHISEAPSLAIVPAAVPEPASLVLFGLGLAGLGAVSLRGRRRRQPQAIRSISRASGDRPTLAGRDAVRAWGSQGRVRLR